MKPRTASVSVAKCGMPRLSKASLRDLVLAEPNREDRLAPRARLPVAPNGLGDRLGRLRGRGQRGRHVQHQDGIVLVVGEERLEGGIVASRVRVADDVDRVRARPCRRESAIELRHRIGRNRGERTAEIDQPIDREDADPATVRQDRKALARERLLPAERFGGGEELVEVEHAQKPGAAKGGLIDRVGAGERAGMRCRGPRALSVPARLDHDDGLRARGGAGRRHELAGVGDRLDVEQDRPACRGRRRNSRGSRRNRRRPCRRATRVPRSRPGAAPPTREALPRRRRIARSVRDRPASRSAPQSWR